MNKIDKTEQWLLDGKCHICRREKYCSKPCTKYKRREQYKMRSAIARAMARMLAGK